MDLFTALDYLSVVVFAITGSLAAAEARLDLIGFCFLASLTALGGGTVRDLALGRDPVFWVAEPTYIGLALAAALVVFYLAHHVNQRRTLVWADALALSVAAPSGLGVSLAVEASPSVAVVMAIATGCLGGLMRDVVCNRVPLVLERGDLYVTAACAGALVGLLGVAAGSTTGGLVACGLVTFALRAGSLRYGWKLPNYTHPETP